MHRLPGRCDQHLSLPHACMHAAAPMSVRARVCACVRMRAEAQAAAHPGGFTVRVRV
jgi:hypothetical protein